MYCDIFTDSTWVHLKWIYCTLLKLQLQYLLIILGYCAWKKLVEE
jgi:hypothetical protein